MVDRFDSVVNVIRKRSELCKWEELFECYYWVSPRKLLGGITKKLREKFYAKAPKPPRVKTPRVPIKSDGTMWKRGKRGGTLVHEQLEDFVEKAQNGILRGDLDPRVKKILNEAIRRGWIIIDSEYCVGDPDLGLGTAVDLLCVNDSGDIIVIEIKTGFDNVIYDAPTEKRMKKPLDCLPLNVWAQHQIQLLTTVALFEKMTGLRVKHAEIWVVGTPDHMSSCTFKTWGLNNALVPLMSKCLSSISKSKPKKIKITYIKENISKTKEIKGKVALTKPKRVQGQKKKSPTIKKIVMEKSISKKVGHKTQKVRKIPIKKKCEIVVIK